MKKLFLFISVLCTPLLLFSQKKQLLLCDTFNNRVVDKFKPGDAIYYLLKTDSVTPDKKGFYDKEFSKKIHFRKGTVTALTDSTITIDKTETAISEMAKIITIKKGLKIAGISLTVIGALLLTDSYL